MTDATLDILDRGWVWTLATIALCVVVGLVVERWERVRRWKAVDALLVALAVIDHLLAGSAPKARESVYVFETPAEGRWLRLVDDVDDLDTYPRGA